MIKLSQPQNGNMTTRRKFLAGMAGTTAIAAKPGYEPKLMLQPYVWTQQFRTEKVALADGLEKLFSASQRAGYRRMELIDSFLTPELRERTAALVRQYNFDIPVVYHGGPFYDAESGERTISQILATADAARDLHAGWINTNCNPKPKRERKTDAELDTEVRYLNRLGEHLKQRGLRLMLHNHDADMTEGAREWRHILRHSDPKLLSFCVDVHWVWRGKQDPMELLRAAGPRLASLHVRNSVKDVWSESLGDGDVDYAAVTKLLKQMKYRGLIAVELAYEKETKPSRSLEEDLKISREYAEKAFEL
jgi:inosose dehydratase